MGFYYLGFFSLLLFISLFFYIKKKRSFDAGAMIFSLYCLYSIFSLLLYGDDNLEFKYFELTLPPLIFLFVCLLIAFSPVLLFKPSKYEGIESPSNKLFTIISLIIISSYLMQINYIVNHLSHGLMMILLSDEGAAELYSDMAGNASEGNKGISNLFSIVGNMFYGVGMLLFFYYFTIKKRNKFIILGLGFALLVGIFESIASGQRGGFINRTLAVVGTFFLLKDFMSIKVRRIFKVVGFTFLLIVMSLFLVSTISRFGNKTGGVETSLNRYAGQSIIYFDKYAFDNNGIRYGDRTIPIFKKALLFENVPNNFIERRAKYPHLHINDEVFVTFVGDFCLDFGPVLAFLIITFISVYTRHLTKSNKRRYPFYKLMILHLSLCICIEGGTLYHLADLNNVGLIFNLCLSFFFYLVHRKKHLKYIAVNA